MEAELTSLQKVNKTIDLGKARNRRYWCEVMGCKNTGRQWRKLRKRMKSYNKQWKEQEDAKKASNEHSA